MTSRHPLFLSALLAATALACAAPPPPPVDPEEPLDPGEPPVVDTQAPSLLSSFPSHGASGVAPDAALSLTFSEPMDVFSLAVLAQPEHDFGAGVWSQGDTVVSFPQPSGKLPAGAQLSLAISGADKSGNPLSGVLVFDVAAAADLTPPELAQAQPAAGSADVAINSGLSITFSEPMNQASVEAAVSIAPPISGAVSWDASGAIYTLTPNAALAGNTLYTVTIAASAKDQAGNPLAAPKVLSFTTAAGADTTAPLLSSSLPAASELGVARASNISVSFNEPMNQAATQAAFSITAPAGHESGAFSWSADGKTMTFNPQVSFAYGAAVSWRLTNAAADLAGNTLFKTAVQSFTVVRQGTMVLETVPALDGHVSSGGAISAGGLVSLVGDNQSNTHYRSFLSFDLGALPANTVRLTGATLYAFLGSEAGDAVGTLGGAAKVERVDYGPTLNASDFDLARFPGSLDSVDLIASSTSGWKFTALVGLGVLADWTDRANRGGRTQFRVRFPTTFSDNATSDFVQLHTSESSSAYCPRPNAAAAGSSSCRPHLVVSYEYP